MCLALRLWIAAFCTVFSLAYGPSAFSEAMTVEVMNHRGAPQAGIVVYLTPSGGQTLAPNKRTVTVGQRNKKFDPYVVVMSQYDDIAFANEDDISHHVYSVLSQSFSYRLVENEVINHGPLELGGEVLMACNVHDWMSGYVYVVDTPLYGLTDKSGKVNLEVPILGEYELKIWHPQLAEGDLEIILDIELPLNAGVQVKLKERMKPIPRQESFDSFDALEEY